MKEKGPRYLRLLVSIATVAVLASLVVLIIGWLSKWNTSTQFSDGFFTAGVIFALLGLFSILGGFATRADFKTVYSQSAGDASLADRARQMVKDIRQGYGMLILLVGTGILLILAAILIGQLP